MKGRLIRDQPEYTYKILDKPDYYDSPEGKNPWEKVWGLSKYAIPTSLLFAGTDAIMYTQPTNFVQTVNCLGYWMLPMLGLTSTFATVTYMATNIRGKDDKINYACGVLACGPVLHAWRKSTSFTFWGLGFLMVAALLKKDSVQNGWELFPDFRPEYGTLLEYDLSLVSDEWPKRPF